MFILWLVYNLIPIFDGKKNGAAAHSIKHLFSVLRSLSPHMHWRGGIDCDEIEYFDHGNVKCEITAIFDQRCAG